LSLPYSCTTSYSQQDVLPLHSSTCGLYHNIECFCSSRDSATKFTRQCYSRVLVKHFICPRQPHQHSSRACSPGRLCRPSQGGSTTAIPTAMDETLPLLSILGNSVGSLTTTANLPLLLEDALKIVSGGLTANPNNDVASLIAQEYSPRLNG
jgi:hypothetical protein